MKILIKCVLSCFLVAQSTHATNDFNYQKSIPADPIKHHPWKLTTPEEDEINRRNQTLEGISEDNIHQRHADQHAFISSLIKAQGLHSSSPHIQELFKKAASQQDTNHRHVYLYKEDTCGIHGSTTDNIITINENNQREIAHFLFTMHHELTHYRNYHVLTYHSWPKYLSSYFKNKNEYDQYIETQADKNAAAHSTPENILEYSTFRSNSLNDIDSRGYLTTTGLAQLAQAALEQEQKNGRNPLKTMIEKENAEILKNPEQHMHGIDPELDKLPLEQLQQEQKDFESYQNSLTHNKPTDITFTAINDYKTDQLLAEHRQLQLDYALAKKAETPSPTTLKNIARNLIHLDRNLKEQAYINARVHQDEFKDEPDSFWHYFFKKRDPKNDAFLYLKAHHNIAHDKLIKALQGDDQDQINLHWINREIKEAELEHDPEEVERLEAIKANYAKQAAIRDYYGLARLHDAYNDRDQAYQTTSNLNKSMANYFVRNQEIWYYEWLLDQIPERNNAKKREGLQDYLTG